MIHIAIGLVEINFLERGMITDVASHRAKNVVSPHTDGGDSLRAVVAVHLMKTVTIDGAGELVALRMAARGYALL